MGMWANGARAATAIVARNAAPTVVGAGIPYSDRSRALLNGSATYETFSKAYSGQDLVFATINLLATSAAEPGLAAHRSTTPARLKLRAIAQEANVSYEERLKKILNGMRETDGEMRERTREIKVAARWLSSHGAPPQAINAFLVNAGVLEEVTDHPAIRLLNHPNPWTSRSSMQAMISLDRSIAGNSYWLKARPRAGAPPMELWRLRPDRVRVVPDALNYIDHYEYVSGTNRLPIAVEDIIHFKELAPQDTYYGMPPLQPLWGRISLDTYLRDFPSRFFENGGHPGAVLSIDGGGTRKLSQDAIDDIRRRFNGQFGGQGGWFELLILDAKATYQPVIARGLRDLAVPDLSKVTEARAAMVFGIPASILGVLAGLETSSYANKKADWRVLWQVKMTPYFKDCSDTLNLSLLPEYPDLDEFLFDLSEVWALQEDQDALWARWLKALDGGAIAQEEFRMLAGFDAKFKEGFHIFVPARNSLIAAGKDGELPDIIGGATAVPPAQADEGETPPPAPPKMLAEAWCQNCGLWVGKNLNADAQPYCKRCRSEVAITDEPS